MTAPFRTWVDPDMPEQGVTIRQPDPGLELEHLNMDVLLEVLEGWPDSIERQIGWRYGHASDTHEETTVSQVFKLYYWTLKAFLDLWKDNPAQQRRLGFLVPANAAKDALDMAWKEYVDADQRRRRGDRWQVSAKYANDWLRRAIGEMQTMATMRGAS